MPQHDGLDRREDDEQVERDRQVLDVEQVVLQLLDRVFDAGAVGVAHLRPAGQPGPDDVALAIERDLARQLWTNSGRSGRGPTRLMSPLSTFQSCGSSSSRVLRRNRPIGVTRLSFFARPDRAGVGFGILTHRAELVDREDAAVLSDALLVVQDRPRRRQLHRERHQGHERRGQQQPDAPPATVDQRASTSAAAGSS